MLYEVITPGYRRTRRGPPHQLERWKAGGSGGALQENGKWYAPSWHSYKFFIPKGLDSARITASSGTTSADYRIHATFKANHNATISHATPVQITNPIANKETVQVLSDSGVASFVITSYSIHYTKLYEAVRVQNTLCFPPLSPRQSPDIARLPCSSGLYVRRSGGPVA